VEYFECFATDGFKVKGLLSSPPHSKTIIINVHGFGGDFISNAFVQQMHEQLPERGIAFASFNHRLSGYVVEQYSEKAVSYSGASISPPALAVSDLHTTISFFNSQYEKLVIQSHSFGTNITKNFALRHGWAGDLIFISPSDSSWLYEKWRTLNTLEADQFTGPGSNRSSDDCVLFDIFGVATSDTQYSLPMSPINLKALLSDEVFSEWSTSEAICPNKCLVIFGTADSVANNGKTQSAAQILKWLPAASIEHIPDAGHLLSGEEQLLIDIVYRWLNG